MHDTLLAQSAPQASHGRKCEADWNGKKSVAGP